MAKRGRPPKNKLDPVERINKYLTEKNKQIITELAVCYVKIFGDVYDLKYSLSEADDKLLYGFTEICKYYGYNIVNSPTHPGRPKSNQPILRNAFINRAVQYGLSIAKAQKMASSPKGVIPPEFGLDKIIGENSIRNYWKLEKEKAGEIAAIEFFQAQIQVYAKIRFGGELLRLIPPPKIG